MKFLFFLAAISAVAFAEVEIFLENEKLELPEDVLNTLDLSSVFIKHGSGEILDLEIPEGEAKNIVDDKIIAWLEGVREKMDVGWPELGIPPVDPFTMDRVSIPIGVPFLFKATIDLKDILFTGLQKFVIETINFNILRLSFEGDLDIPDLTYNSDFSVKGRITLVIPFNFGGHFRMKLTHFRFYTKMALGTTPDGYLTLREMQLSTKIDKATIHFDGIIGDGPLNEIVNWILNLFTNGIIKNQIDQLGQQLGASLFEILNAALGNIKLSDLVG